MFCLPSGCEGGAIPDNQSIFCIPIKFGIKVVQVESRKAIASSCLDDIISPLDSTSFPRWRRANGDFHAQSVGNVPTF